MFGFYRDQQIQFKSSPSLRPAVSHPIFAQPLQQHWVSNEQLLVLPISNLSIALFPSNYIYSPIRLPFSPTDKVETAVAGIPVRGSDRFKQ